MPAQKHKASAIPDASGRRRSGRISTSGQKSKYFEDDSDDELANSDYNNTPLNGNKATNGKKRGRPSKKAAVSKKKAKLGSDDDDDGDEYAEEDSDVKPESDDEEEDDDDEDAPPRVTITPLVKLREIGGVPYEDTRLHKNTLLFLKDLKANNKRSWLKCMVLTSLTPSIVLHSCSDMMVLQSISTDFRVFQRTIKNTDAP